MWNPRDKEGSFSVFSTVHCTVGIRTCAAASAAQTMRIIMPSCQLSNKDILITQLQHIVGNLAPVNAIAKLFLEKIIVWVQIIVFMRSGNVF